MNKAKRNRNKPRRNKGEKERQLVQRLQSLPLPYFNVKVWNSIPPAIPRAPRGPRPGAAFSTRQMASTFNTSTGLSNLAGSSGIAAQMIVNSSTPVLIAIGFELTDLDQVSTFSSMFDQYRIDKVLVRFYSRNNATMVFNIAAPNGSVPLGYVTLDLDDASAPASISAIRQYDKCQTFNGNTSLDVELTPRPTAALFASGAFSGYQAMDTEPWIDISNTDVPHYGLKIGLSGLTLSTTSSFTWDIEAHYWVSFRNTR